MVKHWSILSDGGGVVGGGVGLELERLLVHGSRHYYDNIHKRPLKVPNHST